MSERDRELARYVDVTGLTLELLALAASYQLPKAVL